MNSSLSLSACHGCSANAALLKRRIFASFPLRFLRRYKEKFLPISWFTSLALFLLLYIGKLAICISEIFFERILICDVLVIRIERLELFDEFEEWHMMQVSESFAETES